MSDSKLINLLRSFSKEDLKNFERFVASPFFARERNLTPLLGILKTYYPDFDKNKLTKKILYQKLYPGIDDFEKNDKKVRVLFSELYKMGLDFLIHNELQSDPDRKTYYLLNSLRIRKLDREFRKIYESAETDDDIGDGNIDFLNKYFLKSVLKNYSIDRNDYENVFNASIKMREYSVVSALINCLKFESEKVIMASYNIPVKYNLLDNLMDKLDTDKLLDDMRKNNDVFYRYLLVYNCAGKLGKYSNDPKYFFELRSILKHHHEIFGRTEKFALWVMMETYCSRYKSVNGSDKFLKETFSVYNEMLSLGTYKHADNEDFNVIRFRNMAITAWDLRKIEWLEDLVNEYSEELNPLIKTDILNYVNALISHGKKEYEKALEHLMNISMDFFQFKIDVKFMMLVLYYELGYYEQVFSAISAANNFLKNSSDFSVSTKNNFRRFMNFLKKMVNLRIKANYGEEEILFFEKEIEVSVMRGKVWMLQKTKEMKNK